MPRRNVQWMDPFVVEPCLEVRCDKFRPVVTPGIARDASLGQELIEGLQYMPAVHLLLPSNFQTLPGVFIEYCQELALRPVFRASMHKVKTPDVIGLLCGEMPNIDRS